MYLKYISRNVFLAGTLMIWIIKFLIRPFQLWPEGSFFLGIAPNLLGSFLIPFAAYWLFTGKDYLLARVFRIQTNYDLRLVCLMGFGMVIVNEYLQLIPFFGRTFDYHDILFSSIGLLASHIVFGKIQTRELQQANN